MQTLNCMSMLAIRRIFTPAFGRTIFLNMLQNQSSAFHAHALGALAKVASPGLNFHLGTMLPSLLSTMGDEDKEVQASVKEIVEVVVLVIDEKAMLKDTYAYYSRKALNWVREDS
ncbi:Translational activator [Arachis hypogaea]|nr:Translational activator [Arachis hypogaea]